MKTQAFLLAVLLLIGLSLAHSTSTDSTSSTQKKNPTFDAAAKEEGEPTPLRPMSQQQQDHGRLYGSYTGVGKRLTDLVRERGEDVTIATDPPLQMTQPEADNGPHESALESLAREADVIVTGWVKDKTSLLNAGETYIFTEHGVTIEEVLKNNALAPIRPGDTITITRAGGKVQIDGRTVTAIQAAMKPIRVGSQYLLFLKSIPTSDAYQSISPFEVKGDKIIALDTQLPNFQRERQAQKVLNAVRKAGKGSNDK